MQSMLTPLRRRGIEHAKPAPALQKKNVIFPSFGGVGFHREMKGRGGFFRQIPIFIVKTMEILTHIRAVPIWHPSGGGELNTPPTMLRPHKRKTSNSPPLEGWAFIAR